MSYSAPGLSSQTAFDSVRACVNEKTGNYEIVVDDARSLVDYAHEESAGFVQESGRAKHRLKECPLTAKHIGIIDFQILLHVLQPNTCGKSAIGINNVSNYLYEKTPNPIRLWDSRETQRNGLANLVANSLWRVPISIGVTLGRKVGPIFLILNQFRHVSFNAAKFGAQQASLPLQFRLADAQLTTIYTTINFDLHRRHEITRIVVFVVYVFLAAIVPPTTDAEVKFLADVRRVLDAKNITQRLAAYTVFHDAIRGGLGFTPAIAFDMFMVVASHLNNASAVTSATVSASQHPCVTHVLQTLLSDGNDDDTAAPVAIVGNPAARAALVAAPVSNNVTGATADTVIGSAASAPVAAPIIVAAPVIDTLAAPVISAVVAPIVAPITDTVAPIAQKMAMLRQNLCKNWERLRGPNDNDFEEWARQQLVRSKKIMQQLSAYTAFNDATRGAAPVTAAPVTGAAAPVTGAAAPVTPDRLDRPQMVPGAPLRKAAYKYDSDPKLVADFMKGLFDLGEKARVKLEPDCASHLNNKATVAEANAKYTAATKGVDAPTLIAQEPSAHQELVKGIPTNDPSSNAAQGQKQVGFRAQFLERFIETGGANLGADVPLPQVQGAANARMTYEKATGRMDALSRLDAVDNAADALARTLGVTHQKRKQLTSSRKKAAKGEEQARKKRAKVAQKEADKAQKEAVKAQKKGGKAQKKQAVELAIDTRVKAKKSLFGYTGAEAIGNFYGIVQSVDYAPTNDNGKRLPPRAMCLWDDGIAVAARVSDLVAITTAEYDECKADPFTYLAVEESEGHGEDSESGEDSD